MYIVDGPSRSKTENETYEIVFLNAHCRQTLPEHIYTYRVREDLFHSIIIL